MMSELPAYKLRVAPDELPDRWMTGTPCNEGIVGALEAVAYLADLGRATAARSLDRRAAIRAALEASRGTMFVPVRRDNARKNWLAGRIAPEGNKQALFDFAVDTAFEQCKGLIEGGAPGVHLYSMDRSKLVSEVARRLRAEGLL